MRLKSWYEAEEHNPYLLYTPQNEEEEKQFDECTKRFNELVDKRASDIEFVFVQHKFQKIGAYDTQVSDRLYYARGFLDK